MGVRACVLMARMWSITNRRSMYVGVQYVCFTVYTSIVK